MPHITLEMSNNIIEDDLILLSRKIHLILVESLPCKLEDCKTKISRYNDFLIGEGSNNGAFFNVNIEIMEGRSDIVIKDTSKRILTALSNFLEKSSKSLNLKISVSIKNLPTSYCKL